MRPQHNVEINLTQSSIHFSFHFLDIFYFSTKNTYTLKTCTYEIIKIKISKKKDV